ncbi:MAG: hypothetical protein DRN20_04685 [Thermoplasmata archaeon]|nr:MAG: hypothetical protein DRN20_04685 [Thermoplasmata archaeon]
MIIKERNKGHEGCAMSLFVSMLDMKEFRGVKRFEKPIELRKFNVLIGRNNSGKSTVLEALSLLPHPDVLTPICPSKNYMEKYHILEGHLHKKRESLIYLYYGTAEIKYKVGNENWRLVIKHTEKSSKYEFYINNEQIKSYREVVSHIKPRVTMKSLSYTVVFIPNDTEIVEHMSNALTMFKNKIMKKGAHKSVARMISMCVDDKFTEIHLETQEARREDGNYIKLYDLGDGVEKATKIMLLLEAFDTRLLLWDDFETSAHPSLLNLLLTWIEKKPWQVVISTHNLEVLHQIAKFSPQDSQIILMKKSRDDVLHHKTMSMGKFRKVVGSKLDFDAAIKALNI